MNKLEHYKDQYVNQNIQFVLVDDHGRIAESDQTFLPLSKGEYIYDVHPFFASYEAVKEVSETVVTFNCVHLSYRGQAFITDVKMIKKEEGMLLVIYDLSDHYLSYQKIAQARNESIINSELVVLKNLELEEREKFKNAFIQNFSHELRNPLTGIIAITNVIEQTKLTAEQLRMVEFLKESNANLKLMLTDIMSISMISTGKLQLRPTQFNLHKLLRLLEFTFKSKGDPKLVEFNVLIDEQVPEFVEGDRLRLFQVLTNLLDNAMKFTKEGQIGLQVLLNQKRANKANLRFEVSDTGIGIPESKIETIFESFSQLEGKGKEQGSGLGLPIVKGLLKLMNSKIQLTTNLGEGSTFYFNLSLNYQLRLPSAMMIDSIKGKTGFSNMVQNRKYKLLLVEDDDRIQSVLFKALLDTDIFYIDLVNDGALVLETVMNTDYDIILMDVDLPNVSGDQNTRLIREFPFKNIKSMPIVGITANAYEDDIADYLKKGMNAVVPKPFELSDLLDTILAQLKK